MNRNAEISKLITQVKNIEYQLLDLISHEPEEPVTKAALKDGVVIYTIHALGLGSFLNKLTIVGEPYKEANTGWFVKARTDDREYVSEHSLGDMNIITNCYNQHKAFFSKEKAEHYLRLCKSRPR